MREHSMEYAIKVLREAIDNYGKPESILTDGGTQFYTSGGEKKAKWASKFEKFPAENGIGHIVEGLIILKRTERLRLLLEVARWREIISGNCRIFRL